MSIGSFLKKFHKLETPPMEQKVLFDVDDSHDVFLMQKQCQEANIMFARQTGPVMMRFFGGVSEAKTIKIDFSENPNSIWSDKEDMYKVIVNYMKNTYKDVYGLLFYKAEVDGCDLRVRLNVFDSRGKIVDFESLRKDTCKCQCCRCCRCCQRG